MDELPPAEVLAEIDAKVSMTHLEETLMREGLEKVADPWPKLAVNIAKIRERCRSLFLPLTVSTPLWPTPLGRASRVHPLSSFGQTHFLNTEDWRR